MIQLRRILVATDFSAAGHAAVARAGQLAAQFQAELTILHATPNWTLFSRQAAAHQPQYADITENAETLLRDEVQWLKQQFGLTTVRGQIHQDRATVAIARTVESLQPNLLILGAGGEHVGSQTVLGGTALKLISRAAIPLLLVRDPAPLPYPSAVAAIGDEMPLARRVVRWATAFAGAGPCHVVRAYDAPYATRMRLCRDGDARIAQSAEEQRRIAEQQCAALQEDVLPGSAFTPHAVRGAPLSTVLEQVAHCAARLVVVGQHQHHVDEHPGSWVAGVGTRMAYHCPTDVLLVP